MLVYAGDVAQDHEVDANTPGAGVDAGNKTSGGTRSDDAAELEVCPLSLSLRQLHLALYHGIAHDFSRGLFLSWILLLMAWC